MKNENEAHSDLPSHEKRLAEQKEKIENRIKEIQMQLDFINETYFYSAGTVIVNPDRFPAKIKFVKVMKKRWSIMCYQN